jgi:hypothetical protein
MAKYINYAPRSAALKQLDIGESLILAEYTDGAMAQERSSIMSVGARLGRTFQIRKVHIVVVGELVQTLLRVTRLPDGHCTDSETDEKPATKKRK